LRVQESPSIADVGQTGEKTKTTLSNAKKKVQQKRNDVSFSTKRKKKGEMRKKRGRRKENFKEECVAQGVAYEDVEKRRRSDS